MTEAVMKKQDAPELEEPTADDWPRDGAAADDWPRDGEGQYCAEDLRDALKQLQLTHQQYVIRWHAFIEAGLLPRMGRGQAGNDRSSYRPITDDAIITMILALLQPEATSDLIERCREAGEMKFSYCSGPLGMQLELPPRIPGVDRMNFFQALKYTFFNPDRVSPVEVAYGEIGQNNPVAWIDTLQYGFGQQPVRHSLVFGSAHRDHTVPPIMRLNYFPGQTLILMSAAYKAVVGNVEPELPEPAEKSMAKPVRKKRQSKASANAHA